MHTAHLSRPRLSCRTACLRHLPLAALLLLAMLLPLRLLAQSTPVYPPWWSAYGVLSSGSANDYAAANQGQLKNIASAAVAELDVDLAQFGGSGLDAWAASTLIETSSSNDFAAINLGQLKNTVQPIYDRLLALGYNGPPLGSGTTLAAGSYPWVPYAAAGHAANDYAAANLGQLKYLFSFDVTHSSPGSNGLPDWWLEKYYPSLFTTGTSPDPNSFVTWSGSQVTIQQAYQNGWNPLDYYNGQAPTLTILSGSGQTGAPGGFAPLPLTVSVADGNGRPLPGAPVTFTITSGSGMMWISDAAPSASAMTILADSNGDAQVFFQFDPAASGATQVIAAAGPLGNQAQALFPEIAQAGAGGGGGSGTPWPITPPAIPVETYPEIDVSGGVTGGDTLLEPLSIALDDSNNGAFVYVSATDQYGNPADIASKAWVNGQVTTTYDAGLPYSTNAAYGTNDWEWDENGDWGLGWGGAGWWSQVAPDGTIYSTVDISPSFTDPGNPPADEPQSAYFGFQYGSAGRLIETDDGNSGFNLPVASGPGASPVAAGTLVGSQVLGCIENGYFGAAYYASGIYRGSYAYTFVYLNGQRIGYFGSTDNGGEIPFDPVAMSGSGQTIGYGTDGNCNQFMDPAGHLTTTGSNDYLRAVNNLGQVIGDDGSEANAFIWQNGVHTYLASLIPPAYQGQLSDIGSWLLSNPDPAGVIHILFYATFTDPATGNATYYNTYVLSGSYASLSATTTSLAQVQLADGESGWDIQAINANGVLALINQADFYNSYSIAANAAAQPADDTSPTPTPVSIAPGAKFTVTTTAPDRPSFAENFYTVYAWGFTANVSIPNIQGTTNNIKCGVLKDVQFTATTEIGNSLDRSTSLLPAGTWPNGYIPDSQSTTTSPNSPQPLLIPGTLSGDQKTYTWTFGPDKPSIGITAASLASTSSITDTMKYRYYLFVQVGNAAPQAVLEITGSYNSVYWAVTNPTGKTIGLKQQNQLSTVTPSVGQSVAGGPLKDQPVNHPDNSTSEANTWLNSHWLPVPQ